MSIVSPLFDGISLLVLGLVFLYSITVLLRSSAMFNHVSQLVLTVMFFIVVYSSVYIAFGEKLMHSLASGLSIGVGLALQPLLKSVVNGFVFDGTRISQANCKVQIGEITGRIVNIGMLHTWLQEDKTGRLVMINNDMLEKNPLKVLTDECSERLNLPGARKLRY